ncbi:hypothetical protein [uncultured Brevundimonas sp.]|uniref:hypothetical protein n=1 Tax=uncultured Brevundimonas sp. TaxID=213418 RepID=UPI0026116AE8|nr:hypothetical protein [uncultured Brevundimonas sp.]
MISKDAATVWDGTFKTVEEDAARFLPPDTPEAREFMFSLGRALMGWNMLEGALRQLLEVLADMDGGCGRATFLALTAETNTFGIESAVNGLMKVVLRGEKLSDAKFAVDQVTRLRDYRNFYIHSVSHLARHEGLTVAPSLTWSAKHGNIKHHTAQITARDLDKLAQWSSEQSAFIKALIDYWHPLEINGLVPPRPNRPETVPKLPKTYRDVTSYAFGDPTKRSC